MVSNVSTTAALRENLVYFRTLTRTHNSGPARSNSRSHTTHRCVYNSKRVHQELCRRTYGSAKVTDYYIVLGVERSASISEIKNSYYELAKKYHPDRQAKDENKEIFNKISEAYQVLSNAELRNEYDEGKQPHLAKDGEVDAEQILQDFERAFNKQGARGFPDKVVVALTLDFKSSALGVHKMVSYKNRTLCLKCDGSGSKPGSPKLIVCPECEGAGVKTMPRFFLLEAHDIDCPKCSGEGVLVPEPCSSCFGRGGHTKEVNKKIVIPPGVNDGDEIPIEENGNVVVRLTVETDPSYIREGDDIFSTLDLCMFKAALGGFTECIETVHGSHTTMITPGTQHGDRIQLAEQGIRNIGHGTQNGSHIAVVRLVVPRALNSRQKSLLQQFAEVSHLNP
eukprot:CFRG3008T1